MRGGLDITNRFNDRTTQIKVEMTAGDGEGDMCAITVDDRGWKIARPTPEADSLQIWLGYQEVGLAYMGQFKVDDVTFIGMPRAIQITGTSTGFNDLKKAPQIANWENKKVADILSEIAGQTGLGLSISESAGNLTLPFKNQAVSNLHIINQLERLTGSVGKIVDGNLMFVPRDSTNSASGIAMPTLVLREEHFGNWSVRYSSRPSYGSVKAAWRDKEKNATKYVESPISGGAEGGQPMTLPQVFNSEAEALAASAAQGQALKRAEVYAMFDLAKGDPWIKDQQTILVRGMRDGIDGSYVVDRAIHSYIKSTGIKTSLECRAPGDNSDYSSRDSEHLLEPDPGEPMGTELDDDVAIDPPPGFED